MDKFSISQNGYNVREVNKFVDDVITQTEGMLSKMKTLKAENERLKAELQRFDGIEKELKDALFKAEQSGSEIKKQAYEERNTIIEDARKNASRIVNDALLRAEKVEIKADTLERNMRIFKKKFKLIVEQQMSVVDEIDELELDR